MKNKFLLIAFATLTAGLTAQVSKKVVVEHFTNSNCGNCASRNPGFYTNLNAQTNVIHLAIHPSSPYSSCVLSQHNATENDGRTNYYGIYGSTPRLVIQGSVIANGANYGSASIFTPYLSQTTPVSIKIYQYKYANDSIVAKIVVKTVATHTLNNAKLFIALAEESVNHTGSNGEPVHYDVFRKSLTGTSGFAITIPANVDDSIVYVNKSTINNAWDFSKIFTLAILQDATTKSVIQSEEVAATTNNVATGLSKNRFVNNSFNVFINERDLYINQSQLIENATFLLHDLTGRIIFTKTLENIKEKIDLSTVTSGIYIYQIKTKNDILKTDKLFIK
jgi:hypothetical protein